MTEDTGPEVGTAVSPSVESRPRHGDRAAAISKATVRVFAEYIGRGPTRARTIMAGNVITVVLEDSLTKAERRLVQEGAIDMVLDLRRRFQGTMRGALMDAVEEITGRKVVAFLSDHQAEPDYASEVFVLESEETNEPERDAEVTEEASPPSN